MYSHFDWQTRLELWIDQQVVLKQCRAAGQSEIQIASLEISGRRRKKNIKFKLGQNSSNLDTKRMSFNPNVFKKEDIAKYKALKITLKKSFKEMIIKVVTGNLEG